jgi:hypothetical protein
MSLENDSWKTSYLLVMKRIPEIIDQLRLALQTEGSKDSLVDMHDYLDGILEISRVDQSDSPSGHINLSSKCMM